MMLDQETGAIAQRLGFDCVFEIVAKALPGFGTEIFVFEITGASDKLESFIALMIPLGLVEVSRTGIAAIARGPEGM